MVDLLLTYHLIYFVLLLMTTLARTNRHNMYHDIRHYVQQVHLLRVSHCLRSSTTTSLEEMLTTFTINNKPRARHECLPRLQHQTYKHYNHDQMHQDLLYIRCTPRPTPTATMSPRLKSASPKRLKEVTHI